MKKTFEEQRVEIELTAQDVTTALHDYAAQKFTGWAAVTGKSFLPMVSDDGEYLGGGTLTLIFSPTPVTEEEGEKP